MTLSIQPRLVFAVSFVLLLTLYRASATETVLHTFAGSPADGATPVGGLIGDGSGNFFGTTTAGGMFGAGTIFELEYDSTTGGYSEIVLYNFTGGSDGGAPMDALVMNAAGDLFGTTEFGGTGACSATGCGVVFELIHVGTSYTDMTLYTFTGGQDGGLPTAGLVEDGSGNLYGTASCGGNNLCSSGSGGDGVVFRVTGTTETVLLAFSGSDGAVPRAPLVRDASGNLFGTTEFGGSGPCSAIGCGVVFQFSPSSGLETILHPFSGSTDGGEPIGGLLLDSAGNLYGTASCGGSHICSGSALGHGTLFEIAASGVFSVVHKFNGTGGSDPTAGVVVNAAGTYLYGTTFAGGTHGKGEVYRQLKSGTGFTILYSFKGLTDGGNPFAGVTLGPGLLENSHWPPTGKHPCPGVCGLATQGGVGSGVAFRVSPI